MTNFQADSALVVSAVERLTHNVLRCLSDVVQHRKEVWGAGGKLENTGENAGIFMDFPGTLTKIPTQMGCVYGVSLRVECVFLICTEQKGELAGKRWDLHDGVHRRKW